MSDFDPTSWREEAEIWRKLLEVLAKDGRNVVLPASAALRIASLLDAEAPGSATWAIKRGYEAAVRAVDRAGDIDPFE